jgi:5-methylcytosine-specific restriction protein A
VPTAPRQFNPDRYYPQAQTQRSYERRHYAGSLSYGRPWTRATQQWIAGDPDNRIWCVHCRAEGKQVLGEETDHITPHRGDATLFWAPSNWQRLCKRHHSMKTNAEVRGTFTSGRYVICGPAGSGKTTWVEQRRQPGDVVWDFDVIAGAMTQAPSFPRSEQVVSLMRTLEDALIGWLQIHQTANAFVIQSHVGMANVIAQRIGATVVTLGGVS